MKSLILIPLIISMPFFANCQAGKWEVLKTKNEVPNRNECGMAAVNGKIYLIGGGNGQTVESFDPATLTWKRVSDAPVLMHHFQPVAYNNSIYVLAAFTTNNFPNQASMANAYVYDVKKDSWQKGGEMPVERRRAAAGAAVYKGKLYLVNGILHGHSSGTTNMFDSYDPVTKKWTALPDAPHIRDHCAAAVVKDKLYVVGGRNTSFRDPENKIFFYSQTVTEVDCYDFVTGKWSTLPARLPLGSGGGALVNLDDVLYYMGGERATSSEVNRPRKNVYYYDPSGQAQWIETDSLHYARNGMAAAVVNGKIYAGAGSGGGPGGPGYKLGNASAAPPASSSASAQKNPPAKSNPDENNLIMEVFTKSKSR